MNIYRKMTKGNRASGTDSSGKVTSITLSTVSTHVQNLILHRLSLTDPPVLVRFPYAFVLRILLSFDFPYYTRWGTSIIKDSHFYTRYGIKVGAQYLFIPQRVYFYISCLIVSTTLLISSSVNVGPEGRQSPISNKCSLVPFP